mmetsp:Transcript_34328/g.107618  ORF Transcript_34328/g.107618 Transcript_34328/m.107618 type:complete len:226 (+) Transcript_34328:355-1032(+)
MPRLLRIRPLVQESLQLRDVLFEPSSDSGSFQEDEILQDHVFHLLPLGNQQIEDFVDALLYLLAQRSDAEAAELVLSCNAHECVCIHDSVQRHLGEHSQHLTVRSLAAGVFAHVCKLVEVKVAVGVGVCSYIQSLEPLLRPPLLLLEFLHDEQQQAVKVDLPAHCSLLALDDDLRLDDERSLREHKLNHLERLLRVHGYAISVREEGSLTVLDADQGGKVDVEAL